jgi:tetratricopeptide (TPR) repeat protein
MFHHIMEFLQPVRRHLGGLFAAGLAACADGSAVSGPAGGGSAREAPRPAASEPGPSREEALAALQAGRALFQKNDPLNAAAELRRAVRLDPGLVEAQQMLGKVLLDLSSVWFGTPTHNRELVGEAIQAFRTANELEPGNVKHAFWLGYALILGDEPAEGARVLRRAVELDPAHGLSWKQLGLLQAAEGESQLAKASLARAMELLPGDDEVLFHYGMQLEAEDDLQGARECYEKASRINPANPGVYSRLVAVCERLGDAEGATKAAADFATWKEFGRRLKEATLRVEQSADAAAMVDLGMLYREAKMTEPALDWFRRACNSDPGSIDEIKRRIAGDLDSRDVATRLELAELLLELGRAQDVIAACGEIEVVDPGNEAAKRLLRRAQGEQRP